MRRLTLLYVCLSIAITTTAFADSLKGSWSAHIRDDGSINLQVHRDNSTWGQSYARTAFTGLTDAMLHASNNSPARFSMIRDAGRFDYDGVFGDGEGGGHFVFTPNRAFVRTLESLGISSGELDDDQLFWLACADVSADFIREMQSLGYRGDLDLYKRFRIHGVNSEFIRSVRELGYNSLTAEDLVRFRIHGVKAEFIRALRDAGYQNLSADDLVRFRIHGVTSEGVREFRTLGYQLSAEDLVRFQIHGVKPSFVRELRDLGYKNVDAEDLVRMAIHGVTTRFIREMKDAGYVGIPVEKLIEMRIHGIDANYVKHVN